jgi:hypothetical protein
MPPHADDGAQDVRFTRLVLGATLAVFLCSMAVCGALDPTGLSINEGSSYYGTRLATAPPYAIAMWTIALGLRVASSRAVVRHEQIFLRATAGLVGLIVFIPYSWSVGFNVVHVFVGSSAFTLAMALLVLRARRSRTSGGATVVGRVTVAVALAAWVLSGWWIFHAQGHLIWAQVVFLCAFVTNAACDAPQDRTVIDERRPVHGRVVGWTALRGNVAPS